MNKQELLSIIDDTLESMAEPEFGCFTDGCRNSSIVDWYFLFTTTRLLREEPADPNKTDKFFDEWVDDHLSKDAIHDLADYGARQYSTLIACDRLYLENLRQLVEESNEDDDRDELVRYLNIYLVNEHI